jgi:glycolate oxidase
VDARVTVQRFADELNKHGMRCHAVLDETDGRTVGEIVASCTRAERERVRESLLGLSTRIIGVDQPARFGAITIKDVAGYDTKRIFIGGGGSFGDLEQLTFKLSVQRRL